MKHTSFFITLLFVSSTLLAQFNRGLQWTKDGNAYYRVENKEIVQYTLPELQKKVVVTAAQLTPAGKTEPLNVRSFVKYLFTPTLSAFGVTIRVVITGY